MGPGATVTVVMVVEEEEEDVLSMEAVTTFFIHIATTKKKRKKTVVTGVVNLKITKIFKMNLKTLKRNFGCIITGTTVTTACVVPGATLVMVVEGDLVTMVTM